MDSQIQQLPIDKVYPSKSNRRDMGNIEELAESIRTQGLLQPIVVREQIGKGFEIVAGCRRQLACKMNKMVTIPCLVISATDAEAGEMRTVENLQRKDPLPMESAEEISHLLDSGKSVQEIADSIGKPAPWVAKRAKLMDLAPEWKKVVAAGQLADWSPAMLELIARNSHEIQEELFKDLNIGKHYYHVPDLAELKRRLERFSCQLSAAKWKAADADLDPKAGACTNCTKRTSAAPNLFDEYAAKSSADRCLDPECFKRKAVAILVKKEAELLEKNKDMILIGDEYEARQNSTLKGKTVINKWNVQKAKKSDPGAVPALVVTGDKAGSVEWVKVPKGTTEKAVAGGPKSMKEKRAGLEKRRNRAFTEKVLEILNIESEVPKIVKRLELSKAVAAISTFGADYFDHDGPPDWDNIKSNTLDDPQDLKDRLFVLVIPKWLRELDQGARYSADGGKPYALEVLTFLEVPKDEILNIEAYIVDQVPEPKGWAVQALAEKASKKTAKKAEKSNIAKSPKKNTPTVCISCKDAHPDCEYCCVECAEPCNGEQVCGRDRVPTCSVKPKSKSKKKKRVCE